MGSNSIDRPILERFGVQVTALRRINEEYSRRFQLREKRIAGLGSLVGKWLIASAILGLAICLIGGVFVVTLMDGSLDDDFGVGVLLIVAALVGWFGVPTLVDSILQRTLPWPKPIQASADCGAIVKYLEAMKRFYYLKLEQLIKARSATAAFWFQLDGRRFELEFAALLSRNGYSTRVTNASNDGGIDIIASKYGNRVIISCKNWNRPVGPAPIRELQGVRYSTSDAWVVCPAGFSDAAKAFAKKCDIRLLDIKDILKLCGSTIMESELFLDHDEGDLLSEHEIEIKRLELLGAEDPELGIALCYARASGLGAGHGDCHECKGKGWLLFEERGEDWIPMNTWKKRWSWGVWR